MEMKRNEKKRDLKRKAEKAEEAEKAEKPKSKRARILDGKHQMEGFSVDLSNR